MFKISYIEGRSNKTFNKLAHLTMTIIFLWVSHVAEQLKPSPAKKYCQGQTRQLIKSFIRSAFDVVNFKH